MTIPFVVRNGIKTAVLYVQYALTNSHGKSQKSINFNANFRNKNYSIRAIRKVIEMSISRAEY